MKDKKKCGFVLKSMYENIPLKFGSKTYVNNKNITDEMGMILIKNHPRGKGLFEVYPEKLNLREKIEIIKNERTEELNNLSKKELQNLAENLGISEDDLKRTKEELATLVYLKENGD